MNTKENLAKREIGNIFHKLCIAIAGMKSAQEAGEFLRDLLSYPEAKMIAKRLKVAELILAGKTYEEIREDLKVSYGKIARVQEWLNVSGDGYRKVISRMKNEPGSSERIETENFSEWRIIKKRYSAYFWPELLLESIIENANRKQKESLERVIKEMDKMKIKTALHRRINKLLLAGQPMRKR